jgi:RNA-directed DNA polymerase
MLLEQIQSYTRLSSVLLEWYAVTASKRYKVYSIPKRNGGLRVIEHPSKEIKALQRLLNKIFFIQFPVHACATAYRVGSGIKLNASQHMQSNFTLHNDFESSFRSEQVGAFLRRKAPQLNMLVSEDDISFVQRIVCRNGALTIGAPSSPILTNLMMFDFDVELEGWCSASGLVYTRYADDIFISSTVPDSLRNASVFLRELAAGYPYANLRVNLLKSAFLSRRYRRAITGLVVTTDRNISIGRDRKTKIKSDIYKYLGDGLEPEGVGKLVGMLAFVKDVEPTFFATLQRKYGSEELERLLSGSFRRKNGAVA